MDYDFKRERWLDTAVSGIRFGLDRREVRAELEGHIEDKMADLQRIFPDIPPDEARDRALAGMGDPEELKTALARVHRPWLGWLWRASQVLLALAVCALLMVRGPNTWDFWGGSEWPAPDRPELVTLEPDGKRVKTDGFTITMTQACLYSHYYPEGEAERRLALTLRRSSPMFWCGDSGIDGWNALISAEDSLGSYYPSYHERWNEPQEKSTWESVWPSTADRGLFHTDYAFMIPLKDPDAEWVRLDYDWMGRRFSFTVDLKEGDA